MSRNLTLCLLALLPLGLSGCSGGENVKYTIFVIPKGRTHEFWKSIERGANQAALDLKAKKGIPVKIRWEGPAREDQAQPQIDIVKQAISRRASGIVLAPQHRKTLVDVVEDARNQDIPVIIIDSGLENESLFSKYIATDNYKGGQLAAKHLLEILEKKGKKAPRLVRFQYMPGSESTMQREKGFKDYVDSVIAKQKKNGEPLITWVSTDIVLGATKDSAQSNSRPHLDSKRKEIDGIFAPNESSTSGVVEALESLDLTGKMCLVGFDSSEPLLQALRAGKVDGLILQDPYRMGYLGVWAMVQHLEGRDITQGGKHLGTGEVLVTKENLDSPEIRGLFDPTAQKERTIEIPKYLQ